jgi:hypothetical protein
MDELLEVLAEHPQLIGERLARDETWRDAPSTHATSPLPPRLPLPALMRKARLGRRLAERTPIPVPPAATKLYQPAHGRYYVATASLACERPGLPERAFTPGGAEAVGFVLRRLLPDDAGARAEFAWTPAREGARWLQVAPAGESAARLSPREELLPLFPLAHADAAAPRTLWGGLVPVGRREEYFSATIDRMPVSLAAAQQAALRGNAEAAPSAVDITARLIAFQSAVTEPWKALVRSAHIGAAELRAPVEGGGESTSVKQERARALNIGWAGQSWLVLLDFADWLDAHLPAVAAALPAGPRPPREAEGKLYDALRQLVVPAALAGMLSTRALPLSDPQPAQRELKLSLAEALADIRDYRAGLDATTELYTLGHQSAAGLPPWHFPLAAVDADRAFGGAAAALEALPPVPADHPHVEEEADAPGGISYVEAAGAANKLDRLTALVADALVPKAEADETPLPFAQRLRDAMNQAGPEDPGHFVLRFVHLNEDCGPLHPPTLSEPTEPFRLAHFFDHEAPARPVRITMPLDTSAAALRKYPRNTAFVISEMLCGQVQRARGLGLGDLVRQVLPFPLHKDIEIGSGGCCKKADVDIGMICSLSIPIITICALILLMIIVTLLDFLFRWLPWFIMCFPLPKLKGKTP